MATDRAPPYVSVELPLKLESVANLREHWSKRARRAKAHRHGAFLHLAHAVLQQRGLLRRDAKLGGAPLVRVTITRVAPRALDGDNLAGACKATRDGVADALGVDDRDARVEWVCAQEKRTKVYAARIEVQTLEVA